MREPAARTCDPEEPNWGWSVSRSCRTTLILLVMSLALTACGRIWNRPPPEGEPVLLTQDQLTATWTDSEGGTLTLKPDGTFVAEDACNDYHYIDGFGLSDVKRSGSGKWESGSNKKQSFVGVSFDVDHGQWLSAYAALKRGKVLMLWIRVGDEDNDDPHCILTSQAS